MTIAIEILIIWKKPGTKSYDCNRDAHYLCQYINDFMSEYPEKSRLKLRYFHENPAVGYISSWPVTKNPFLFLFHVQRLQSIFRNCRFSSDIILSKITNKIKKSRTSSSGQIHKIINRFDCLKWQIMMVDRKKET